MACVQINSSWALCELYNGCAVALGITYDGCAVAPDTTHDGCAVALGTVLWLWIHF